MMRKIISSRWTIILLLVAIFLSFPLAVRLITDWFFFVEVGYQQIFVKTLSAKLTIAIATFAITFIFLFANLFFASSSTAPWFYTIPEHLIGTNISFDKTKSIILTSIVSVFISIFSTLIVTAHWLEILQFFSAETVGVQDPIFATDISFYLFSLPVYRIVIKLAQITILLALVVGATFYFFQGKIKIKLNKQRLFSLGKSTTSTRFHLGVLLILLFLTGAANKFLAMHSLLLSPNSLFLGVSYTDAAIRIPLFKLIIGIYLLAGLGSLLFIVRGRIIGILASLIFLIILNISQALIPALVQSIIVEPNQLVKETPFIGHNIAATRAAYDLENVEERTISAEQQLTADDIAQHDLTIKNVRLWDRAPLLSTFSQIQEIRTYYQFSSITNDRYTLGDELRQIMLSPRDLEAENLPNRNWINEHLIFTHGYGAVAGPVNQVTQEGLPVLFVKDIPPQSDLSELSISQPALYYSQRVNDYVIVNTKLDEFDYPQGDTNVSTRYTGSGGVQLSSLWQRFLFSLRFGSEKILLSNDLTNESRILYYRQFQRRAEKLLPFLTFDRDPYLVIADGKLYWLLDAYTVSSLYPYSQPVLFNEQSVNYVRNSIKIVIDAYNGTVGFYRTDDNDPIIATLSRIFPNVFKDLSAMPDNLRAHIRYPEDLFTTQAVLYTVYHMQDPQIFYNREDQWEIAGIIDQRSNQQANISPRHLVMRLPGEETAEYIFMLPFTPKGKDNLSAWMAARNDGDHYGKLLVFSFPKDRLVFGPKQIIDRINQDTEISQQLSLWDQRGSQVIQGPLLVIPIEGSLLYVWPLYLKAERGNIPELKRVMVAYENSIVMRRRLEDGLAAIFSSDSADKETEGAEAAERPSTPLATEKEELIRTANDHYQAALQAQREGNWSLYGEEIRKLGEVLKRLQ